MPSGHKVSCSNHELYREALRWARMYVLFGRGYGCLLLLGALDVLVTTSTHGRVAAEESKRRAAALGLVTAGIMGVLVSIMVGRCCKYDGQKAGVVVNWHDLFKYTHMGRAMTAAMTAVLTWRATGSLQPFSPPEGGVGRVPSVIMIGAILSMVTAGFMHFLHFRMRAAYMEYGKLTSVMAKPKRA